VWGTRRLLLQRQQRRQHTLRCGSIRAHPGSPGSPGKVAWNMKRWVGKAAAGGLEQVLLLALKQLRHRMLGWQQQPPCCCSQLAALASDSVHVIYACAPVTCFDLPWCCAMLSNAAVQILPPGLVVANTRPLPVPVELFQLSSLSEILNLDTWLNDLDDVDRASLRALLPNKVFRGGGAARGHLHHRTVVSTPDDAAWIPRCKHLP
jgi:hypothetical protein